MTPLRMSVFDDIYAAACKLLPPKLDVPEARPMLIAISLQESRMFHRRQLHNGPARGLWQFERGDSVSRAGVWGVLNHTASRPLLLPVLDALCYDYTALTSHTAIEHNDILACVYARLLLYTDPYPLPKKGEHQKAWECYALRTWRPGAPHRGTWDAYYDQGWAV